MIVGLMYAFSFLIRFNFDVAGRSVEVRAVEEGQTMGGV